MRIFRYLAKHKIALVLVFVLLIAQAACELSLPSLTSSIVDVGIQQRGIEKVVPQGMTAKTHDLLDMLLDQEDEELISQSYAKTDDGTYALTEWGREHEPEIEHALMLPLVMIHDPASITTAPVDLEEMLMRSEAGELSKADITAYMQQTEASMDEGARSLLPQRALSSVASEYSLLGLDLDAIQMNYLLTCGAAMLALTLCGMAFAIGVGFVAARTGAFIGRDLRRALFARVVSFSEAEINRFSAASLITRGTNDIQQIQMVSIMLMRVILYAPILALGGIIMVISTNAELGWVVVCAIIVLLCVLFVLFRVTMPRFKRMQRLIDKVNLISREMLEGMMVVRAFDRKDHEEERFEGASRDLRSTQLFTNRAMSFMMPTMMLVMNLTSIAIIWFGGQQVDMGMTQTGDLIAFITYSMVIIMGFLMIGMVAIMLPRASVASERVDEVIETQPSVVSRPDARALSKTDPPKPLLAFENVSFRYGDESGCALEDVSFQIEEGMTFAIVGSTGSGKTTLVKLLLRFFDPSQGRILLDGHDMRDVPLEELRSQFGYVPQKAFLFSGTIDTNVAYADEGMPRAHVMHALDIAQATEFVSQMPKGVITPIAQGGSNVSGGQRQRLAIARAIARQRRVLLFDDSFSALDYATDAALRASLRSEFSHLTQIVVAQRISTVMEADRILVLEEGRVVGCGTHAHLMKSCPEYAEIALSQLSPEEAGIGGDVA